MAIDEERVRNNVTEDWGAPEEVALYLDRCQVDTPQALVATTWKLVKARRTRLVKVVDFGAGDGRFSAGGKYERYLGFEVDSTRCRHARLPPKATLVNQCAFSHPITDADLCIGNPPYVRNQDLPRGWRERAAQLIRERTGVAVSGLANAWQYFALLGIASTGGDGLVALIIPYEWVSRPSSAALRHYLADKKWNVSVYRLRDKTFARVLTTSCITIIDKRGRAGAWEYFRETDSGEYVELKTPTGSSRHVLQYAQRRRYQTDVFRVARGLSPGTQRVLTLTEAERARHGLRVSVDVVPCVTSLRTLQAHCVTLTEAVFRKSYRNAGRKCWLIRTDRAPSQRLALYLASIPESARKTSTCTEREHWWRFKMPDPPAALVASGFRDARPKSVVNRVRAVAVGGVFGVYGLSRPEAKKLVDGILKSRIGGRVVVHAHGLRKIEVGQLATFARAILSIPSSVGADA